MLAGFVAKNVIFYFCLAFEWFEKLHNHMGKLHYFKLRCVKLHKLH